jgi:N-acetylglucosamine-6-phosphate deacetylase
MSGWFTLFTNARYVLGGELVEDHLVISDDTGYILKREGYVGGDVVDLDDNIIAPGFLELHTNGANAFHFTHFDDEKSYAHKVDNIARYYATQGVTGFWATIPTVKADEFQKVGCFPWIWIWCTWHLTSRDFTLARTARDTELGVSSWCTHRRPIPPP